MIFSNLEVFICHIVILLQFTTAKFTVKSRKNGDLNSLESRYRFQSFPNNRVVQDEQNYLEKFQTPRNKEYDYWQENINLKNSRIFFEDEREKGNVVNDFYHFMSSIFGGNYNTQTTENPYRLRGISKSYQNGFVFRPMQSAFIPPQKPIKASVIKLETVTRSPHLPLFYHPASNYNSHVGSILNHVLIENNKNQHRPLLTFSQERQIPIQVVHNSDITKKQSYFKFLNRTRSFITNNQSVNLKGHYDSDRFSTSIQGQYLSGKDTSYVPAAVETTIPSRVTSLVGISPANKPASINEHGVLLPNIPHTKYIPNDMESRFTLGKADLGKIREMQNEKERIRFDEERSGKPKKRIAQSRPNIALHIPADIIANLTAEGLSKIQGGNINYQKILNRINLKNLIIYERGKLNNLSNSRVDTNLENLSKNVSQFRENVNFNDNLSLDAKILKDTNWDGLTTQSNVSNKQENNYIKLETTTKDQSNSIQRIDFKPAINLEVKREKSFWEIEEKKSSIQDSTEETANEKTTIVVPVTSEPTNMSMTTETVSECLPETTTLYINGENINTQAILETITKRENLITEAGKESTTLLSEEFDRSNRTKKSKSALPRRKYRKRQREIPVKSMMTEQQKQIKSRKRFPKRQKPNITLVIGGKTLINNREINNKNEVMRFSDDDKKQRPVEGRKEVLEDTKIFEESN